MMDEKSGGRRAQHKTNRRGDEMHRRRGNPAVPSAAFIATFETSPVRWLTEVPSWIR